MNASPRPPAPDEGFAEPSDLSLALGGPLYQLYLRGRLVQKPLRLLWRRMVALPVIVWLPLFVLTLLDGTALGSAVHIPFLYDIEVHAKYLLALPLLIASELMVHRLVVFQVRQF